MSFAQVMELLDLFSKIAEHGQQLKVTAVQEMVPEIHQLRMRLLAITVQLLVAITPVSDMHRSVVAQFRQLAVHAGLR